MPSVAPWVHALLSQEVLPAMSAAYAIPQTKLRVHEAFVVLYDADGLQRQLTQHQDGPRIPTPAALPPCRPAAPPPRRPAAPPPRRPAAPAP